MTTQSENQIDAYFLQTVQLIANKHKCRVAGIDYDKRIIHLEGGDEVACAVELVEILGNYAE